MPQLAHMIIHLEAEWDDAILERFALVIAQQSLHFALQFNWILQGALEDYQPELPSGLPNPSYNPLYYARCIKLSNNLERCVVYGRPRSQQLQRLYEQGKITKQELHIMENADRRFHALQLTSGAMLDENGGVSSGRPALPMSPSTSDISNSKMDLLTDSSTFGGFLLYKRQVRLGALRRKGWKRRYFVIEEQMLNCYRSQDDGIHHRRLIRAMPLDGAIIVDEEVSGADKYPHMFTVANRTYEFKLRAKSAHEKVVWIRRLKEENECSSLFQQSLNHMRPANPPAKNTRSSATGSTPGMAAAAAAAAAQQEEKQQKIQSRVVADLSPAQLARYEFFRNERRFIRRLTDIAEELRFLEKDDRKKVAPTKMRELQIPECVYLPLCNSSDIWRRACKAIPDSVKVFSTKARCPMIMYFLARFGEETGRFNRTSKKPILDVAEFMHSHFEVVAEPSNGETPGPSASGGGQSVLSQISEGGERDGESLKGIRRPFAISCGALTFLKFLLAQGNCRSLRVRRVAKLLLTHQTLLMSRKLWQIWTKIVACGTMQKRKMSVTPRKAGKVVSNALLDSAIDSGHLSLRSLENLLVVWKDTERADTVRLGALAV